MSLIQEYMGLNSLQPVSTYMLSLPLSQPSYTFILFQNVSSCDLHHLGIVTDLYSSG